MKEARFTERYWRDKTRFLVNAANQHLSLGAHDSLEEQENQSEKPCPTRPGGIADADLSVYRFDFTGAMMRGTNRFIVPAKRPLSNEIFSAFLVTPHAEERVRHCAREAAASYADIVMVAGLFNDRRVVTSIFVQMQRSSRSEGGERYQVIKTVCSVAL